MANMVTSRTSAASGKPDRRKTCGYGCPYERGGMKGRKAVVERRGVGCRWCLGRLPRCVQICVCIKFPLSTCHSACNLASDLVCDARCRHNSVCCVFESIFSKNAELESVPLTNGFAHVDTMSSRSMMTLTMVLESLSSVV